MTTELTGRALAESATVAMGGQIIEGGRVSANGGRCGIQRYDTDPATIPEMLAWLQEGTDFLELKWDYEDGEGAWEAWRNPGRPQRGATLNEALARLVVAVSKAKGAK